jgi:hypothetical protein
MSDEPKPARIDDVSLYLHLRARLEHEDGLIVSRLTWLMAAEAFFFTAYAIVLNGPSTSQHLRMLKLIPAVALVCSMLVFIGIVAAVRAMGWIREQLRSRVADPSSLNLPPLHTPGSVTAGLAAPLILPLVFFLVWLYLLSGP